MTRLDGRGATGFAALRRQNPKLDFPFALILTIPSIQTPLHTIVKPIYKMQPTAQQATIENQASVQVQPTAQKAMSGFPLIRASSRSVLHTL